MIWLAQQMGWLTAPEWREFACDCAERVLPVYDTRYPGDTRPRVAIETARRYARGEATAEELRAAASAASAAYAAASSDGAAAAAYAAAAYAAAYAAADAAAYAAADAAAYAAAHAAAEEERLWQADRLRDIYTPAPLKGEATNG